MIHILVLAVLLVSGCAALPCDEDQAHLQECLQPLEGYEYVADNAIVPTMEPSALTEHCRRYTIFEECMVDVKPQCDQVDRLHYDGVEAFYQYLCHEGYNDYLSHRDCFVDRRLHQEGDTCNHTLSNSQSELSVDNTSSVTEKRERICLYTNQYLDCVENVVTSFCGASAAAWQRTLDTRYRKPTMDAIGCSIGSSFAQAHWVAITIGVLLTVSIIVVVASVIILIMQYRKKRRPSRPSRESSAGAPPPYADPGPYMVYNPSGQSVSSQAGALPDKSREAADPSPYQSRSDPATESAAGGPETVTSGDGAVAAGYFGVEPHADAKDPRIDRDGLPKYQTLDSNA